MKIAVNATTDSPGDWESAASFALEAERLGAESIWTGESWGFDAITPLAYLSARATSIGLGTGIVQLGSRSPANLAMTAMSMQSLSDGRFRLGLGTSGPQVIEGWHGISFSRPIQRTREIIEIVRMVTSGERVAYDGEVYQLPLPDGEGRSIRSSSEPVHVPIYVAALGPRNLNSLVSLRTAGSAARSSLKQPRCSYSISGRVPSAPAEVWTTSISRSRCLSSSQTMSKRPARDMRVVTASRSARWGRSGTTSTRTPLPDRDSKRT